MKLFRRFYQTQYRGLERHVERHAVFDRLFTRSSGNYITGKQLKQVAALCKNIWPDFLTPFIISFVLYKYRQDPTVYWFGRVEDGIVGLKLTINPANKGELEALLDCICDEMNASENVRFPKRPSTASSN